MKYIFDTNMVSDWMRGEPGILSRLSVHSPSELTMAAITLAEVLYGIEKSPHRKMERTQKVEAIRSVVKILAFDEKAAGDYARVRCHLEATGAALSERDAQIAATALAHSLVVVTHNVREFQRVPTLGVEDWR